MMALQQQLFQRISPTAVILCKINDRFLWNMLRLILLNQASYSKSFSLGMFVTNKNVDVLLCGNGSNQSQSKYFDSIFLEQRKYYIKFLDSLTQIVKPESD